MKTKIITILFILVVFQLKAQDKLVNPNGKLITVNSPAASGSKGIIKLTNELAGTADAPIVTNSAVIGKILTGFNSTSGTVTATDDILSAIGKIDGNIALKAPTVSPTFTGTPTAPTPVDSDNSTAIATTAFVKLAAKAAVTAAENKFIAVAGQISFTVSNTPISNSLSFYVNGVRINSDAVTVSGSVINYVPLSNGNYNLELDDVISITYLF